MKQIYKRFLIYCLLLFTVMSCSNQSNTDNDLEKQFSTAIPISDMNQSLKIALSQKKASYQSGSEIDLIIYNRSPYYLYFDNTSHIKLMASVDNGQWTEVKNAITYKNDMALSPYGTALLDTQYTVIRPIIEQTTLDTGNKEILLRIVVVAEIMNQETHTGQNVGSYVDVNLSP